MALLSVTDVLLFFTLVMNAVAISKPRGGLISPRDANYGMAREVAEDDANETDSLIAKPSHSSDAGALGELKERAGLLLLAFRRCGIFIAVWNISLMFAMIFVLP